MLGSIYAMVALGLTLIFSILEIPNFAHGSLYMIGAYISFILISNLGLNYWIALVGSMLVLFAIGVLVEKVVYRPFYKQPPINMFIVAVGLIFIFENAALAIWGPEFRSIRPPVHAIYNISGVIFTAQRLLVIVIAVLLITLLHFFIKHTRLGAAIEATSQNRQGAQIMGINAEVVGAATFGVGTALAAIAATLVAPISLVYPTMGVPVIAMAFVIIIIGGMGNFFGAVIGGYLIGLSETLLSTYVTSRFVEPLIFGSIVLLLAIRPTGLFGKEH
jgi:branched-chain amino acid transport system permease protein